MGLKAVEVVHYGEYGLPKDTGVLTHSKDLSAYNMKLEPLGSVWFEGLDWDLEMNSIPVPCLV